MLTAWPMSSQNGTIKTVSTKKDSIILPFEKAKKLNLDIIDYKRLIENNVEKDLKSCLKTLRAKDTVINLLETQTTILKENVLLTEKQLELRNLQLNTKTKQKGGWVWGITGIAIGLITGALVL